MPQPSQSRKPSTSGGSSSSGAVSSASKSQTKKGAEFLCKVRWKNPLPPLPFAPKLLRYEINEKKYTQFQWSDWMKRQSFPLLAENDLGMELDLVDLDGFQPAPEDAGEMTEEDQVLLTVPENKQETSMKARHRPVVSWLRRTEYISGEASKHVGRTSTILEQSRLQRQRAANPSLFDRSRDHQIELVEKTFEVVQKCRRAENPLAALKHPRDSSLKAVQTWPVFPDFGNLANSYSHCYFDDDPALKPVFKARSQMTAEELQQRKLIDDQLKKAILAPTTKRDAGNEPLLSFFLPTIKDQEATEEDEEEKTYETIRDYKVRINNEDKHVQKFFIVMDPPSPEIKDGQAVFNVIASRMDLTKRRMKNKKHRKTAYDRYQEASTSEEEDEQPNVLQIKRRRLNAEEEHARMEQQAVCLGIEVGDAADEQES